MSKQVDLKVSFDFGQACLFSLEIRFKVIQQFPFCLTSTLRKKKRNICIVHFAFDCVLDDLGKVDLVCVL